MDSSPSTSIFSFNSIVPPQKVKNCDLFCVNTVDANGIGKKEISNTNIRIQQTHVFSGSRKLQNFLSPRKAFR